ncbi:MAG: hypothetical protein M1831_000256 [Alyxoria varia]|nr:MAG: hypothetical protein M1831_000256 [Alyxoria varia]
MNDSKFRPVEFSFTCSHAELDLEPYYYIDPHTEIDDFYSDEDFESLSPYDWKEVFSTMTSEIPYDGIVSPESPREPREGFFPRPLQLQRQQRVVSEKSNDRGPLSVPPQNDHGPRSAPPSVMSFDREYRESWVSPVSPDYYHEESTPPSRRYLGEDTTRDTFVDAADVGLFVQAMTGLDDNIPSMGPAEPSQGFHSNDSTQGRLDIPFLQPQGFPTETRSAPHTPNIHILPPDMDQNVPSFDLYSNRPASRPVSRPSSQHSWNSRDQRTTSETIFTLPSDDHPPDDELPDYAQSQREAAEQSKLKSRGRAAELERRWASSMNQPVNR